MNILHVSAQKPDSTGSGIYLAQTVASFARKGHSQAVIAGIAPNDNPRFPEGVRFFPVRFETDELPFPVVGMSNVMPYTATRYCDMTPQMVEQFKAAFTRVVNDVFDSFVPDIVICHHLYLAASVVAHTVRAEAESNPALTNCTLTALSHSTDINQMRLHTLERDYIIEGMYMLDEVFALHAPQALDIELEYGIDPARIRIIGTGYDDAEFHRGLGLREKGARRLVYVGKIWRRKGVASLIRAINLLPEDKAPSETILIGGYSDKEEYEAIVALANASRYPIAFAGVVEQHELIRAYARANVFVLPSFYEGLPLVILEAMGCGCNIVATDLPGIQEWIFEHLPNAPIWFVKPPRMYTNDEVEKDDLPAFEQRLAEALSVALDASEPECDTSPLSWDAVCARMTYT